ncbi:MAG: HAMP domain-containing protein [Bacteroidales bacterium]|nr:MAG: HAMP domain-containing protein [Bacteroidales bacterium]
MKIKLKIRQKILIYILTISAFLYIVAIGYIVVSSRKIISRDAILKIQYITRISADKVENIFDKELSLVRTFSQAFTMYRSLPQDQWKKIFLDMYLPVLHENPQIFSLWDSWEYKEFLPGYTKDYGRFVINTWQENGQVKWKYEERSMTGDPALYGGFKKNGIEAIWEPYLDQFAAGKSEVKLMVTFASPVLINGKYNGQVATDVGLESLQEVVSKIKPVEGSFAFIVSNAGIVAGHPNKEVLNKNIKEVFPNSITSEKIIERIQKGAEFYFISTDDLGKKHLVCFAPINAGKTFTPWALVLSTPITVITHEADNALYVSLGVGIVGLLLIVIVLYFVSGKLTKPIRRITTSLNRLADGEIADDLKIILNTGDEIEEMSKALNISVEGLSNKAIASTNIGNGNYDSEIHLLSEKDTLGQSLINMRDSLKKAKDDEEKRKVEDLKRTWTNEGFAKFADILRENNNDLQDLSDSIIRFVVKYLGANQGGIFLWNEEDKDDQYFELVSTYAWDRKKYVTKRIEKGEGLVGACAMEKETIFLNTVPKDYVEITSGLGGSNPRCVILIPLKFENQVLGVIEMASFNRIEKYQIEFLEKIGESIASTISSVRINARTKALLEQSQQQSEEMAAQEEEMRQNMEELQATQEEAARKSAEIENLLASLNESSYFIEYDLNGKIVNVNEALMNRLNIERSEIVGKYHSDGLDMTENQKAEYEIFWNELRAGKSKKIKLKINWKGNVTSFIETYYPIKDIDGNVIRIMKLSNELDDFKG